MQLARHYYKKTTNDGAGAPYSAPPVTGKRKVGNPYTINGVTYYPIPQSEGYRKTGIASWYGRDFHGKKTANGERYNMYALTAAHPTLPLPTWVRVTNLENGKSVRVRLNDRGPFARGRLIDLSYTAARTIDMVGPGTAPVLVEALPTDGSPLRGARTQIARQPQASSPQPRQGFTHRVAQKEPAPMVAVRVPTVEQTPLPQSTERPAQVSAKESAENVRHYSNVEMYVQTGAFSSQENALAQKEKVQKHFANVALYGLDRAGQTLYRVRVGPVDTVEAADDILAKLVSQGFNTAIIAVDKKASTVLQ